MRPVLSGVWAPQLRMGKHTPAVTVLTTMTNSHGRPGAFRVAVLRPATAAPEPRTGVGSRSSSLEKSGGPLLLALVASGGRLRAVRCCR